MGLRVLTDDLLAAAVGGSEPEIARLMEAIAPRVRLMVAARLSPSAAQQPAVEDIAQEALLALIRALPGLSNANQVAFRALVSTIVSRRVADFLRRSDVPGRRRGEQATGSLDSTIGSASSHAALDAALAAGDRSPSSAAAHSDQLQRVLGELANLKPRHREVITLAFFDQLPMSEIAMRMTVSRPAASMLLIRAVRTLRRNLTGRSDMMEDPE